MSFNRRRGWVLVPLVALVLLLATPANAPASTTDVATRVGDDGPTDLGFATAFSEPYERVGDGVSRTWLPGSASVTVEGTTSDLTITASGGDSGDIFTFRFVAPAGEQLTPGTYVDPTTPSAVRPGQAGLLVDRTGDGDECPIVGGRFDVLELSPDLSRVHLTFHQECGSGLFGELWVGAPPTDPGLQVAASHLTWPTRVPGERGTVAPVTVYNDGDRPVDDESVVVRGDEDFTLLNSSCRDLAAGGTCTAWVSFLASRPGSHAARLLVRSDTARRVVQLTGTSVRETFRWSMAVGDTTGSPDRLRTTVTDATAGIGGGATQTSASFAVSEGAIQWRLELGAGSGRTFLPGEVYVSDERGSSTPDLSVDVGDRGCEYETGFFVVDEAVYHLGVLERLAVRFERTCLRGPQVEGAFTYRLGRLDARPTGAPPGPVTELRTRADGDGRPVLAWRNPLGDDWARTIVRGERGLVPPAGPHDGEALLEGGAHRVRLPAARTRPYSLSVFTVGRGGTVGGRATITVGTGGST